MSASVVVRFLQAFDGFNVGDLDVMPSCLARVLVDAGVAVVVDVDEAERRRIMRAALAAGR